MCEAEGIPLLGCADAIVSFCGLSAPDCNLLVADWILPYFFENCDGDFVDLSVLLSSNNFGLLYSFLCVSVFLSARNCNKHYSKIYYTLFLSDFMLY